MFKLSIHKVDVVLRRIQNFGTRGPAYLDSVVERCMELDVLPRWYEHISLEDHSLEDLRRLGHPYAARFAVDSFIHPDSEVHKQSGSLYESTHVQRRSGANGAAWLLINTSPHYVFLRYGTVNMRMRDPGGVALGEALPFIKRRWQEEVKYGIVEFFTA